MMRPARRAARKRHARSLRPRRAFLRNHIFFRRMPDPDLVVRAVDDVVCIVRAHHPTASPSFPKSEPPT